MGIRRYSLGQGLLFFSKHMWALPGKPWRAMLWVCDIMAVTTAADQPGERLHYVTLWLRYGHLLVRLGYVMLWLPLRLLCQPGENKGVYSSCFSSLLAASSLVLSNPRFSGQCGPREQHQQCTARNRLRFRLNPALVFLKLYLHFPWPVSSENPLWLAMKSHTFIVEGGGREYFINFFILGNSWIFTVNNLYFLTIKASK